MSTTSPNFSLLLATTSDNVNVVTQIANNFSSLDSIMAVVHTGSGQLKASLAFTTPTLINPVVSGTASGAGIVIATTGQFNTITASGGALTINTFNIGTYALPSTIGATGALLTVVTGNAVFVAPSGGTGANTSISNLASVAINTNLNTFSAGFVTVDRIVASSGAVTGLTSFQATAGTFAGLLTALGTVTANVVNCTGGMGTFGNVTIGTWALPVTIAATGVMRSLSATATWYAPAMVSPTAFSVLNVTSGFSAASTTGNIPVVFRTRQYDPAGSYSTASGVYTAATDGVYRFSLGGLNIQGSGAVGSGSVGIVANGTAVSMVVVNPSSTITLVNGTIYSSVASGNTAFVFLNPGTTAVGATILLTTGTGTASVTSAFFNGERLFEF